MVERLADFRGGSTGSSRTADLTDNVACMKTPATATAGALRGDRGSTDARARPMLDESEFLSPYGIRALSRIHKDHPTMPVDGQVTGSTTSRRVLDRPVRRQLELARPIWFPVNFLLVEALQKFHHYFGDSVPVECPTGSGTMLTLAEVATELSQRLSRIFLRDATGRRPVFGGIERFQQDPHWRDYVPFHEYFHGDDGRGVGASHQTGWTAWSPSCCSRAARPTLEPAAASQEAGRGGIASDVPGFR